MDTINNIIDDLTDHVRVLKELGKRTVEMDPQVVRDLEKKHESVARTQQTGVQKRKSPVEEEKREPLSRALLQNTKPLNPAERTKAMLQLQQKAFNCSKCGLCKNRRAPVMGQGNLNSPDVMFIGATPGIQDDESGQAFSGEVGKLLTKMINAMGYKREDVYLTNTCKCRTSKPSTQAPTLDEMKECSRFLEEQIKIIRPKTIVVMGEHANRGLFHNQRTASQPQGTWTQFHGIPVMPTFHPGYILRFSKEHQNKLKRSVWNALTSVMQLVKR